MIAPGKVAVGDFGLEARGLEQNALSQVTAWVLGRDARLETLLRKAGRRGLQIRRVALDDLLGELQQGRPELVLACGEVVSEEALWSSLVSQLVPLSGPLSIVACRPGWPATLPEPPAQVVSLDPAQSYLRWERGLLNIVHGEGGGHPAVSGRPARRTRSTGRLTGSRSVELGAEGAQQGSPTSAVAAQDIAEVTVAANRRFATAKADRPDQARPSSRKLASQKPVVDQPEGRSSPVEPAAAPSDDQHTRVGAGLKVRSRRATAELHRSAVLEEDKNPSPAAAPAAAPAPEVERAVERATAGPAQPPPPQPRRERDEPRSALGVAPKDESLGIPKGRERRLRKRTVTQVQPYDRTLTGPAPAASIASLRAFVEEATEAGHRNGKGRGPVRASQRLDQHSLPPKLRRAEELPPQETTLTIANAAATLAPTASAVAPPPELPARPNERSEVLAAAVRGATLVPPAGVSTSAAGASQLLPTGQQASLRAPAKAAGPRLTAPVVADDERGHPSPATPAASLPVPPAAVGGMPTLATPAEAAVLSDSDAAGKALSLSISDGDLLDLEQELSEKFGELSLPFSAAATVPRREDLSSGAMAGSDASTEATVVSTGPTEAEPTWLADRASAVDRLSPGWRQELEEETLASTVDDLPDEVRAELTPGMVSFAKHSGFLKGLVARRQGATVSGIDDSTETPLPAGTSAVPVAIVAGRAAAQAASQAERVTVPPPAPPPPPSVNLVPQESAALAALRATTPPLAVASVSLRMWGLAAVLVVVTAGAVFFWPSDDSPSPAQALVLQPLLLHGALDAADTGTDNADEEDEDSAREERYAEADAAVDHGHGLRRAGRLKESIAEYRRAMHVVGNYPRAMTGMVRAYLAQQDGDKALYWAKRLVARQSSVGRNHRLQGDAYRLAGQERRARAAYRRAVQRGDRVARRRLSHKSGQKSAQK